MAYDASKDTEEIIKDIQKSDSTIIRVKKITNQNGESIDIREMFITKDSDELHFGKGLRFKIGLASDIIEALQIAIQPGSVTPQTDEGNELPFNQ